MPSDSRPGDRHLHNPIAYRPPASEREWLAAYAEETGKPVNALLTEGLRLLREHVKQEGTGHEPPPPA